MDNLYTKILAVSSAVRNVEKNISVSTGRSSYSAVSDHDVVLAVKKAEERFGVVSIPMKQEIIKSELLTSADGRNQYIDVVKMTMRIIDVNNPTDFIDVEGYGRGIDTADKGLGKASTYARKYCLLNAYKIATGDDPDQEPSLDEMQLILATEKEWMEWLVKKITAGKTRKDCEAMVNKKNWTITDEAWAAAGGK